jgi:hypothetical protein
MQTKIFKTILFNILFNVIVAFILFWVILGVWSWVKEGFSRFRAI